MYERASHFLTNPQDFEICAKKFWITKIFAYRTKVKKVLKGRGKPRRPNSQFLIFFQISMKIVPRQPPFSKRETYVTHSFCFLKAITHTSCKQRNQVGLYDFEITGAPVFFLLHFSTIFKKLKEL